MLDRSPPKESPMRALTSFAAVAVITFFAGRASAAEPVVGQDNARRVFEEGVDLEKRGDYRGALAKFREAAEIKSTAGVHFHEAYCLEMSGKVAAAWAEYEAADALADKESKAELRSAIATRLEQLRPRVPSLVVTLDTPPKDIALDLDGQPAPSSVLEGKPFRIEPGDHTLVARAPGYANFTRTFRAPEQATSTQVRVVLEREAHDVTPPAESRSSSHTLPILTTAGAVALATTGIVAFVVAGNAQRDAKRECPTKANCDDEQSHVRTLDGVALGSFVGAAGLGVLSFFLWRSSSKTSVAMTHDMIMLRGSF